MLSLLSRGFGEIAELRNRLYDRGILDVFDLKERTLSVGNITTGGTGKTPLIAFMADRLAERGKKVCILTRGYGRANTRERVVVADGGGRVVLDAALAGDEPVELAKRLGDRVFIVADADRVAAAEWARRVFGISVFLLDDGFQHRKVRRDVDIVCVDALDPFGGGRLLPAGRLREPLTSLSRADVVVITRANLAAETRSTRDAIVRFVPNENIFEGRSALKAFHVFDTPSETVPRDEVRHVFAFCGIGNPESFYIQLRNEDIAVVGKRAFPDHHAYTQGDILAIEDEARSAGAEFLVTTGKDAVKLTDARFSLPCLIAETAMELDRDAEFFSRLTEL